MNTPKASPKVSDDISRFTTHFSAIDTSFLKDIPLTDAASLQKKLSQFIDLLKDLNEKWFSFSTDLSDLDESLAAFSKMITPIEESGLGLIQDLPASLRPLAQKEWDLLESQKGALATIPKTFDRIGTHYILTMECLGACITWLTLFLSPRSAA